MEDIGGDCDDKGDECVEKGGKVADAKVQHYEEREKTWEVNAKKKANVAPGEGW